jgi:hypothetical protein
MRAGAAELGNNLRRRGCGEYEEEESVEYHEKRERERERRSRRNILFFKPCCDRRRRLLPGRCLEWFYSSYRCQSKTSTWKVE